MLGRDLELVRAGLSHDLVERALLRRETVLDVVRLVVRDVEIERAVTVDVRQRDGRSALPRRVDAEISPLGELPGPVVHEDDVRPAGGDEEQVEIPIAVGVGERGARRVPVAGPDPGSRGNILELPPTRVPVEGAAPFGFREERVDEPVAVHVA